jgi:hypothetical protein
MTTSFLVTLNNSFGPLRLLSRFLMAGALVMIAFWMLIDFPDEFFYILPWYVKEFEKYTIVIAVSALCIAFLIMNIRGNSKATLSISDSGVVIDTKGKVIDIPYRQLKNIIFVPSRVVSNYCFIDFVDIKSKIIRVVVGSENEAMQIIECFSNKAPNNLKPYISPVKQADIY